MNKAISDVVRGFKLYHVWLYQAYYNLSAKYRRTIFGSLWIAGNMVFTSIAISLVWGGLWGKSLTEVLPYSLAGNLIGTMCLLPFYEGPDLFVGNSSMITNHAYPFTYYVLETVTQKLMLFVNNLIIYYIFMIVLHGPLIPNWTVVPGLALVVTGLFFWGGLIGMLAARFRDLRYLLPNIGHILYFLTPIYWHYEMLKTNHWVADFNPLYALVSIIRTPLMGGLASGENWSASLLTVVIGAILWAIFFPMFRRRIPFWV